MATIPKAPAGNVGGLKSERELMEHTLGLIATVNETWGTVCDELEANLRHEMDRQSVENMEAVAERDRRLAEEQENAAAWQGVADKWSQAASGWEAATERMRLRARVVFLIALTMLVCGIAAGAMVAALIAA